MSTNVLMPQLGESIAEGTIVRWNKKVGDKVDRDEPLFEVSTDKVDAEIPSPSEGILIEIRVNEGQTVPVESVVAVIGQSVEEPNSVTLTTDEISAEELLSSHDAGVVDIVNQTNESVKSEQSRISPVVRKMLREYNLDITLITGTGSGGRVTKADILRHLDDGSVSTNVADRSESMSVMRRKIADHMTLSRRTSAHVHTVFDVNFSRIEHIRDQHKSEYEKAGNKLTYLPFIAKAVIDAVSKVPIVNASLDKDKIVYKYDVNLGIAVAIDDGLIVPVIKKSQELTFRQLAEAITDVAERARIHRLKPEDVLGGSLTITNPGASGSIFGLPIINQPQLAILCVGTIEKRPVVVDNAVVAQTQSYLTLGFDHRVIDGAVADEFMAIVKKKIEQFDDRQV
jgi:2-oxoglutarate dehydrogenase E2 component (dihydrolipoamide succinyltransferase)